MKIGNLNLQSIFFLAPIAGFNDYSFRLLCSNYGASLCYTEMISVNGIIQNNERTNNMCYIHPKEGPVNMQLFGSNPNTFKKAIEIIENSNINKHKPAMYDLNCGCPVPKVTKQIAGAELMKYPQKIEKILSAMTSSTNKPITIKIRLGINKEKENFIEIAKIAKDTGVSAIALHARTLDQGYSGKADWKKIQLLKNNINIPIIGNGDVKDITSANNMRKETNCDFIMIGRKAMTDPQIFSELTKHKNIENNFDLKKNIFLNYITNLKENDKKIGPLKLHAMQFIKGTENNRELKNKITFAKTQKDLIEIFNI